MTKEEYIAKMNEDHEWAPGWDAIDAEFARLYPGQEPQHYGTVITSRAIFGGDEFLDGCSIFSNPSGYMHLVTYGMSSLYAGEEAFGGEFSGWGYEMTMKLKEEDPGKCLWAIDMMSNLARYTFRSNRFFENEQFIQGNGSPIHVGAESQITALLTVNDTTAQTQDTVHGKLEFIQLVGITESELAALKDDAGNVKILIEKMKKDNPELITDMNRDFSYL